ncbi:hypothetical protein ACVS9P_02160 [Caproicibacterium sp. NSD3]
MKCNVFYSWQSDLPNKDNRSFIETCILKAIKTSETEIVAGLTIAYDRDTKGATGAPDIAEVIFDKIARSDIFICDISIINPDYEGRKCPNSNVLLELGYAAKTIGWDKIICLYNLKYGSLADIPFDLEHRRIFSYNSDVEKEKSNVSKGLSEAIKMMYSRGLLYNPLKDHMKGKIDYCLLEILKQISCILYRTVTMSGALAKTKELLSLGKNDISAMLNKRQAILGFFAHNDLSEVKKLLENIYTTITTSNIYPLDWTLTVLKTLDWLRQYQYLISDRAKLRLFSSVIEPSPTLKVVSAQSMNPNNPANSYLLLKKVGVDEGQVLYSGTMPRIDEKYLLSPYRINDNTIEPFSNCVSNLLKLANTWLDETGSEFIFDPDFYEIT